MLSNVQFIINNNQQSHTPKNIEIVKSHITN